MHTLAHYFRDHWLEIAVIGIGLPLVVIVVAEFVHNNPGELGMLTILFFVSVALAAWITERRNRPVVGGMQQWEHLRREGALILTLGLKSHEDGSTILKVIREARPRLVGFVGTQATAANSVAKTVAEKAGLAVDSWRELIVDPTNVTEVRAHVQQLIGWMEGKGVPRSKLLVDLTGGTAVVSVGAYMAAADAKVDTIYVWSQYHENKPLEGSQRVLPIATYGAQ
jgi:hypothetical protein